MLRALPLRDWPEEDRRIWRDALRPAHRLTAGGRASHLRQSSKAILERNYGYFLRVVSDSGALNRRAAAATHVTPEGVDAFVERAELSRNSISVASGVEKVRLMAQTLAPGRDFGWLRNVEVQLRARARPREKFSRMVGSEELVEAGLVLMEEAREAKPGSAGQARMFRNGLIIALLAVCPIRVGSFASLTLGRSFLRIEDGWWIRLAANETKSGRPDERPVPGFLTLSVNEYLRTYRPRFLCAGRGGRARREGAALRGAGPEMATGPLWMAQRGEAMSLVTMKKTITQTTRLTLGLPVNPHLFRACAATTAALHVGAHPRLASGLLQHVDPRVTEAHYNRASSLQACIRYREILDEILCGRKDRYGDIGTAI
jgi:integrase